MAQHLTQSINDPILFRLSLSLAREIELQHQFFLVVNRLRIANRAPSFPTPMLYCLSDESLPTSMAASFAPVI